MEHRAGGAPDQDDRYGDDERPCAAQYIRRLPREDVESVAHSTKEGGWFLRLSLIPLVAMVHHMVFATRSQNACINPVQPGRASPGPRIDFRTELKNIEPPFMQLVHAFSPRRRSAGFRDRKSTR